MPSSLVTRMRMDFLLAKNTTPNRHGPPECGPSRWVRNQPESETQISSGWPAFAGHDSYALSLKLLNDLLAHIGLQHIRDSDAAIGLLVVFQNGDQGAPHRQAGPVQGMQRPLHLALGIAIARVHAPRLEIAAVGAGGN